VKYRPSWMTPIEGAKQVEGTWLPEHWASWYLGGIWHIPPISLHVTGKDVCRRETLLGSKQYIYMKRERVFDENRMCSLSMLRNSKQLKLILDWNNII
jgi:hypothetical protein